MSRPRCAASCSRSGEACGFKVAWAINPHMRVGAADSQRAVAQHAGLVRALEGAGASVVTVPFVHGAFDSVFMKDNAVIVQRASGGIDALLALPKYEERGQEQRARARAMRGLGIGVAATPAAPLEGGDIVVLPGALAAFLGHGFRSSRRAASSLESFLGGEIVPVELRDPRLYHLDMALTVLEDGTALVCTEALTKAALLDIARHPAIRQLVSVPLTEALAFGANCVQVGRTIVWGAAAPRTAESLARRGYEVRRVALDQFHFAGGSAACLVSRLHEQLASSRSNAA